MGKNGGWQNDPILLTKVGDTMKYESPEMLLAIKKYDFKTVIYKGTPKADQSFWDNALLQINTVDATVDVTGEQEEVDLYSAKQQVRMLTFTVEFTKALPEGAHVWLRGNFINWDGATLMTPNAENPLLYEANLITANGKKEFKVVVGSSPDWRNPQFYNNSTNGPYNGNGSVTVDDTKTTYPLFKSKQTPPESIPKHSFIIVGPSNDWSEETTKSERIFNATDNPSVYTLEFTFKSGDEFKVKSNVKGWKEGYNLGYSKFVFDDSVKSYFTSSGDNVKCRTACTVILTFNVETCKVTITKKA